MNTTKLFQTVAFILSRSKNSMDYYNLIKECYIADRKSIEKTGFSITGDNYVSMNRGPVLVGLYQLIKNQYPDEIAQNIWNSYFNVKDHQISLLNKEIDSGKLSRFEENLLSEISNEFKDYTYQQMYEYAHTDNRFPEWKNVPKDTEETISMESIMQALNFSDDEIKYFIREQNSFSEEASLFPSH